MAINTFLGIRISAWAVAFFVLAVYNFASSDLLSVVEVRRVFWP